MMLLLRCPSCAHEFDASAAPLTCPSCNALVPPHPHASPFARLGLDRARFVVDDKALETAWLQRSRVVHPDKAGRKSDKERRAAAEQTAALNDAYRLLRAPFDRAVFLLKLANVDEPKLTQQKLIDFMEAREEAEAGGDARANVIASSSARFTACMEEVARELAIVDDAGYADTSQRGRLVKVSAALAEAKTCARLVADLGGPSLIPGLESR